MRKLKLSLLPMRPYVSKAAKAAPVARAAAAKKPPKTEQNGSKWFIENHDGNRELKVTDGNAKTAICLVACTKSLLQVSNKINTIQIDSCVKSSVVVESCVASVDIINCKSIEVQITDWTPMVTIDGCAGVIVYLSQVPSRACLCVYTCAHVALFRAPRCIPVPPCVRCLLVCPRSCCLARGAPQ
jgi:hypothetical protein